MNKVILDNSIIVKWYLKDEEYNTEAEKIFSDLRNKKIILVEPLLEYYEFNNVINIALKRKRLSQDDALKSLSSFSSLPIIQYSFLEEHYIHIFENTIKLNISSYDSVYITLSEYMNLPFFTVDKVLIEKSKGFNKNIKYIDEYKTD